MADCEGEGPVDLLLVFPAETLKDDDKEMRKSGTGSAQWYLKHFISNTDIFDPEVRPAKQAGFLSPVSGTAEDVSPCSNPSARAEQNSDIVCRSFSPRSFSPPYHDVSLIRLYRKALMAQTLGEFRRCAAMLLLQFLLSSHCGFIVRVFLSVDRDELLVAVTARESFLKVHAEQMGYKLQLDPDVAAWLLGGGLDPDEISPPYLTYSVSLEERFMAKHNCRSPFKPFYNRLERGSIFRGADRLRLITSVIDSAFSLEDMVELRLLKAYMPAHNIKTLSNLRFLWNSSWSKYGVSVPIAQITAYFGERIGFRMCFLADLNLCILPLAVVAPLLVLLPFVKVVQMTLSLGLAVWAACHYEHWKRLEATWRQSWGMEEFEEREHVRPRFQGELATSPVDRISIVKVAPWGKQVFRRFFTTAVSLLFTAWVLGTTLALYAYHTQLLKAGQPRAARAVNIGIGLQMQIYNQVWNKVAVWLVELDNYETNLEYSEKLIDRIFAFQFLNCFCSLFYVAFFKHFTEGCGDAEACRLELAVQLRTFFVINMLCHFIFAAMPYLQFRIRLFCEEQTVDENIRGGPCNGKNDGYEGLCGQGSDDDLPAEHARNKNVRMWSFQEAQIKLPPYEILDDILDRVYAIVELGYVLFFGAVAPEIIALFLLSNVLHLRACGWKLLNALCRPFPHAATGIGPRFHFIYRFICRLAVACNIVLLLLLNAESPRAEDTFLALKNFVATPAEDMPREDDWKSMLVAFLILDRFLDAVRLIIDRYVPDTPPSVDLERTRRKKTEREWFRSMVGDEHFSVRSDISGMMQESDKQVLVLAGCGQGWVPSELEGVVAGDGVSSWDPTDPWFEKVTFESEKQATFESVEERVPSKEGALRRVKTYEISARTPREPSSQ